MDRIENNISQLRHDIDSIVECMNKMVEMTKLSLSTSSDSNKKIETIKKKLSELKHSTEESEMFMEHLDKRLIRLENNCETPSMDNDFVMAEEQGLIINHEYLPADSGSNNTEEYFAFDRDFSPNPYTSNNQIIPGPVASTTRFNTSHSCSSPSPSLTKEEIMKFKYQQEEQDEEICRRSVLYSNFPAGLVDSLKQRNESFWPLLRNKLKPYELDQILLEATKVRIIGKAIKIEYKDPYRANHSIRQMRLHVGIMKKRIPNWGEDHFAIQAALNLRFSKLTPKKYDTKRRILEKLGKKMKKLKKVIFFDLMVLKNEIFLRTCWRFVTQRGSIKRVFTYYDHKIALQILNGELDLEERENRLHRSGYSVPGVTVYHAEYWENVYGEITRTEP